MKAQFKWFVICLIAICLCYFLIFCGSEPRMVEIESQNTEEQITIRIMWWGGENRHKYTQKLLDLYTEKNPLIKFETVPMDWNGYFDKLAVETASGAMPDIVQMDYLYISTYGKNDSLADLQPFIEDGTLDVSHIDETILNTGVIEGEMAGMVLSMSSFTVGYNPELFEIAGLEQPDDSWTWSEFQEAAENISKVTGQESVIFSAGVIGDVIGLRYWLRQHGAEVFNEDGTGLGYEDDALVADFFRYWKTMIHKDLYPDPDEEAQIFTLGFESSPVAAGDAGMVFDWNNYSHRISVVNDTIHLSIPPLCDDTGLSGLWNKPGMFFSVAETSKVKEECVKFINWFVNSKEANEIIMAERGTPVSSVIRKHLIDTGKMTVQQVEMFEYTDKTIRLSTGTPGPDPKGIDEIQTVLKNIGNQVFYGQCTPKEGAQMFREQAMEILESNK